MDITPGSRVLIMGLAKSGEAAARLLKKHGMVVVANDKRPREPVDVEADTLEAEGIEVILGGHPLSLLEPRPDFLVKNPGIPYTVPLVEEAQRQGIPVYTEVEVATWFTSAPIYAITGSNGKTTTTTLVGEILETAAMHPVVAGNIGLALSGVIEHVVEPQPIVLEVSSFQLLGTERFHPRIGALLNLYPAHLDYHQTFERYGEAKMNLFQNMTVDDVAVLNFDSDPVRARARSIEARLVWFSRVSEVPEGVFVRDDEMVIRRNGQTESLMPISSIALKGDHNVENALAAAAICIWAGAPIDAVVDVLTRFRSVEHRTEFVREVAGVDYINDSKATNSQAALTALKSVSGNIVWIAGGKDRGDDFAALAEVVQTKVKHAVLLGQSASKLASLCKRIGVSYDVVPSLEEAVFVASRIAAAKDVVLLSPACASWDMFTSFEERGRMFKEFVHRL